MRRMNSMLYGHQGAFGPHQLLVFAHRQLAPRGSFQDSGRCTMRLGTADVLGGGQRRLDLGQQAEQTARAAGAAPS